jgi:hypothetical protein
MGLRQYHGHDEILPGPGGAVKAKSAEGLRKWLARQTSVPGGAPHIEIWSLHFP